MAVEDKAWEALEALGCTYSSYSFFHKVRDVAGETVGNHISRRDAVFEAYEEVFGEPHPDNL